MHALGEILDFEQVSEKPARMFGVERLKLDFRKPRPNFAARLLEYCPSWHIFVGARETDNEQRRVLDQLDHVQQQIERRLVRPVQIVEHEYRWRRMRQRADIAARRLGEALA